MRDSTDNLMGQTEGVGLIVYTGSREQLQTKLRERDDRITVLEASLRELLDMFNPAPRISTSLTIWGRAAMALDNTPDEDDPKTT